MQLLLTLIGVAGYIIGVSSLVEHLLKHPSDVRRALDYFNALREDREAWQALLLFFPLGLIIAAAVIVLCPGPVAAVVGLLTSLTRPVLWLWDAHWSVFATAETQRRADALFSGADANKNGMLTLKELQNYSKANPWYSDAYKSVFGVPLEDALAVLFHGADVNKDQVLTREELYAYLRCQMNRIRWVKVLTFAAILCLALFFFFRSSVKTPSPAPNLAGELPAPTVSIKGTASTNAK